MIRLTRAHANDAEALTALSIRAFENDIHYGAAEAGGPPGYDSVDWQRRTIAGADYYTIREDETLIGGLIIGPGSSGQHELWRIFLAPERQNRGIGSRVLALIWAQYPLASAWVVDTPPWNERTRHFYQRNGFCEAGLTPEGTIRLVRNCPPPRPVL
ncbi:MAG: GNAT family N-acetyltransferase [Anaerolineae bacterium]|jgi:GNAT superfamily N-acetyltransferase|nr:GNAT family N-acetyltransferase [Chloroflexota bacterium]